jgi:hypothetical protein
MTMGTYAKQYKHIKDRKTFYETLDKAIEASAARPDDPGFARILAQLNAIKDWTKNDKQPSKKKRESLDILRVIAMEYEPYRRDHEEVDRWAQMCSEAALYVKHWLDDKDFAEFDQYDVPWY